MSYFLLDKKVSKKSPNNCKDTVLLFSTAHGMRHTKKETLLNEAS